jgi:ABC-type antimicrobial peptide transport system permease subunit
LRTAENQPASIPLLRAQIAEIDPNVPLFDVRNFAELFDTSIARPRFQTILFGAFGILALALAAGGVYGVLSYTVSQRVHELGMRMCLGARTGDIVRLLARQSLIPVALGAAAGLACAALLTRWIGTLLYGIGPLDAATFALAPSIILVASLAAIYGPIRRATAFDPAVALRAE